ncbi:outer membrane beta-barrel family protein [Spirosoma harenae]
MLKLATDSSLVKAAVADVGGSFAFTNLRSATYRLDVSGVGYSALTVPGITVNEGQTVHLPAIALTQAATSLTEVQVKATKPLVDVQTDKIVLNVEGSLTSAGNSALELLQKAPGVQIDQTDNIILQGKNGVRVFIDGKPSPLTLADLAAYLRTLQASAIDAVEIITQPSARFDAQGNAGIINIRLKKNQNFGTNGSAMLGFAQGAYYPKYNGSLSMNHRTQKMNLFATYTQRNARDWGYINLYRQQNGQFFDQHGETTSQTVGNTARLGTDWFVNKRSTLGILLDGTLNQGTYNTLGRTPIGTLGKAPNSLLIADNQSQSDRANGNANLNYRFVDTVGHELTVDADLGRFRSTSDNSQPNRYVDPMTNELLSERNYHMNTRTNISLRTLKADYTQRLWAGKLSMGFKLSNVQTDNRFLFFDVLSGQRLLNNDRSNQFIYSETIYAGYGTFEKSLGKWKGQFGVRIEQTHSDGQLTSATQQADSHVSRQYLNAFPSAGLTYKLNANSTLSTTYSRRIDRPTYQSLNPFESKLDELSYQKGNAFLRPQYTNTIQVSHSYRYKLTTSLSYSDTQDFFTQLTDTTEGNRNYITTRNLASQRVISLNVSYPLSIAKWWNAFLNVGAYRSTNRANFGEGKVIGLSANVISLYMQHTITLPGSWRLEMSGFYTSPSVWGGTFLNRRYWGSSLGLQRKVLHERGSLVLTISDPFNSQQWRGVSQFGGLYMDASGGYESRQVRINFSYTFGSNQVKGARQRKTGLDEENKRL